LREAEVGDLVHPVVDAAVGGLDVPVDDVVFGQVLECLANVDGDGEQVLLADLPGLAQLLLEVTATAELHDDVAVGHGGQDFLTSDQVGVVQHLEDFGLGVEELLEPGVAERIEFDDLDGHGVV
jgi:hypothetical protein